MEPIMSRAATTQTNQQGHYWVKQNCLPTIKIHTVATSAYAEASCVAHSVAGYTIVIRSQHVQLL